MASSERFHEAGLVLIYNLFSSRLADTSRQLEKSSLPISYYFQMECRRWAPLCDAASSTGLPFWFFLLDAGLTGWAWSTGSCRDAGEL